MDEAHKHVRALSANLIEHSEAILEHEEAPPHVRRFIESILEASRLFLKEDTETI